MSNALHSHLETLIPEYLHCPTVALFQKATLLDTSSHTRKNIRKSNREHKQAAKIQKRYGPSSIHPAQSTQTPTYTQAHTQCSQGRAQMRCSFPITASDSILILQTSCTHERTHEYAPSKDTQRHAPAAVLQTQHGT